jgi:hypothetical protein
VQEIKTNFLMRPAENESRRVGMMFGALVELSPQRSGVGLRLADNEIHASETKCSEAHWTNQRHSPNMSVTKFEA